MANSTVDLSEASSKENSPKICGICNEQSSKYCCPRCEIYYCSLACYKSEIHQNCSESFYKDCINEELAGHYTDDESRHKMIEILNRLRNEDIEDPNNMESQLETLDNGEEGIDSDDEDFVDLKDRISGLNLDDADALWGALTEDERNEFEALLHNGDVDSFMPQWEPWWNFTKKIKLIEDADKKQDEDIHLTKCPNLKNVPKLPSLTSIKPSPTITFNITNVLASYAFVMRYFNGDLEPTEGVGYILNVSSNLSTDTNFEDPIMAVQSVHQNCLKSDLIQTDESSLDVMKHDIFLIIQGPSKEKRWYYCNAALSHVHNIFFEAKKKLKHTDSKSEQKLTNNKCFSQKYPDHGKGYLPMLDISKVKKCLKKIEYYLSFIETWGLEL